MTVLAFLVLSGTSSVSLRSLFGSLSCLATRQCLAVTFLASSLRSPRTNVTNHGCLSVCKELYSMFRQSTQLKCSFLRNLSFCSADGPAASPLQIREAVSLSSSSPPRLDVGCSQAALVPAKLGQKRIPKRAWPHVPTLWSYLQA